MDRANDPAELVTHMDLASKRARLRDSLRMTPGPLTASLGEHAPAAEVSTAGLWRRDPSTWSADPAAQRVVANRLGWLTAPSVMTASISRLHAFAESLRAAGFTDAVLLGMGGSSLAPEVLRAVLGTAPGWPRFHVLDSTDPGAVRAMATPPDRTLYILASKSGTTIEPNALAAHFKERLIDNGVKRWADAFVAITDENTALAERARREGFRDLFINPSDIGGRYSALSFFGLVPAALMGQDVAAILGWGLAMLDVAASGNVPLSANPACGLGLMLGAAAQAGRDKLSLVLPAALEPLGLWVEQLVAESTGKQGVGIVPITGESLGDPKVYGHDRFFVRVRMHGSYEEEMRDGEMNGLKQSSQPVAEIDLAEPAALGAEFVRWEVATAIAGALLKINPFDEPNVQQAKEATHVLLDAFKAKGALPAAAVDEPLPNGATLTVTRAAREALNDWTPLAVLKLLQEGDYLALLAYLGPDPALFEALHHFRMAVRDRRQAATMFGYGPRYLHSTGQLHKGGPNTGLFVMVTAAPLDDVPVPGEPFSFGTLELAQARGDFASLESAGRRALHIHLPSPDPHVLSAILDSVLSRLG
jgi:transaldolase/glucose-6-phosphate isomerase